MNKIFNKISLIVGILGGFVIKYLGGYDVFIKVILTLVVLDYLSGLIKASYLCKLSSEIGYKGIVKKVMMFIVIAGSVAITPIIPIKIPLRETIIVFFCINEFLSLLENASIMLPIPDAIKIKLIQIRDKTIEDIKDVV